MENRIEAPQEIKNRTNIGWAIHPLTHRPKEDENEIIIQNAICTSMFTAALLNSNQDMETN